MKGFEAFDEVQRLIIVGAHPDDLETICGGTVSLLTQRGVTVFSVNCTLGDIGARDGSLSRPGLAVARLDETEEAARVLGIEHTYNLGYPDGELVASLELRAQIARLYRHTGADTLWTFDPFWAGQIHPDHRAAGQAALDGQTNQPNTASILAALYPDASDFYYFVARSDGHHIFSRSYREHLATIREIRTKSSRGER